MPAEVPPVHHRWWSSYSSVLWAGILTTALFLVPAILYQPYNLINHDTYQYIAIATGYLNNPGQIFYRDAYTVGPVLPLVIALGKIVAGLFGPDSISGDVAVAKTIAVACYLAICAGLLRLSQVRTVVGSIVIGGLLVAFLPREVDSLSLNGELLCSALIVSIMVLLDETPGRGRVVAAALLSTAVVYTKLQALPILFVVLAYNAWRFDRDRRKLLVLVFVGSMVLIELLCLSQGGGLARRAYDLLMYSGYPTPAASAQKGGAFFGIRLVGRMVRYFYWAASELTRLFPLFAIAAVLLVGTREKHRSKMDTWYLAALFVATFFSILFSGYLFGHYVLLGLPLIVAAFWYARANIGVVSEKARLAVIALTTLVLLSRFADIAMEPGLPNGLRTRPLPVWAAESISTQVRSRVTPGRDPDVLIHGWDFAWYSAIGKASPELTLALVNIGRLTPEQYMDSVQAKQFKYVLDITARSGLLIGPEYSMRSGIYAPRLANMYHPIWENGGITLYQRTVQ